MRKADIRDVFDFLESNHINAIQSDPAIKKGKDGMIFKGTGIRIDRELTEKEKQMIYKSWSNVIFTKTFCGYAPEIVKNWIIFYPYTLRYMQKHSA